MMVCAECGKRFSGCADQWMYSKTRNRNRRGEMHMLRFCGWKCMQKFRFSELDARRNDARRAGATHSTAGLRKKLGIEDGETHTLEEWAELYGIDYYEFAEALSEYNNMSLEDVIFARMGKEGSHVCI